MTSNGMTRKLVEKLLRPEVTFNVLEGQKYIAYDASLYTMSMHAKNQVNRCSGLAVKDLDHH